MRDTIDMAREVKMPYDFVTGEPIYIEKLKAFEALVRADEREAVGARNGSSSPNKVEHMSKLKSLTFDEYKVAAKATLNEAIDEEPDAAIVLMFHRGSGQFKIKCSKVENRLELIGALEEAKNHIIVTGYEP